MPNVTNSAPLWAVDTPLDLDEPIEIRICYDCYPWYAEVIPGDPVLVREWHANDCPLVAEN